MVAIHPPEPPEYTAGPLLLLVLGIPSFCLRGAGMSGRSVPGVAG